MLELESESFIINEATGERKRKIPKPLLQLKGDNISCKVKAVDIISKSNLNNPINNNDNDSENINELDSHKG